MKQGGSMAELEYQSGTIQVEDVNIHYYRAGSADQAVVLLHGVTDDGMCWKPVADQLAENYTVIMPDVRGHGKSDGPESGYTYHDLAGDILSLLQRIGIQRPFVIGHSMGAMIALTLAGMQPDLPRAVILEDPPPQWKLPHLSAADIHARSSLPYWMVSIKRKTAADLMAEVMSSNPNWAEAERQPWVDSKQRFSLNVLHLFTDEQQSPTDFNSILPGIRCPMLCLTANPKLGGISTRADVEDLSRLVP
jgi:pimeloyl-ACP methyl ester carboxylesterase